METTRHFVTTVYVVCDGETALHRHKKLGMILAPGGHIDRDELPHQAAEREVYEETGLNVDIRRQSVGNYKWSKGIPEPEHTVLDDITSKNGTPVHQHINLIFFAESDSQRIDPQGDDEVSADNWYWFDKQQLQNGHPEVSMEIDGMTQDLATEAIDTFET